MAANIVTADSSAVTLSNEPFYITSNDITVTLGGSDITDTFDVAHGGPRNVAPDFIIVKPTGGNASDAVAATVGTTGLDSTDSTLLNFYITLDAAGTSGEVLNFTVYMFWLVKAPDAGRTAPVGYTAAGNTNY